MSAFAHPDSAVAREALARAQDELSAAVVNHSLRAYHLACDAAPRLKLTFDPELLFVSFMLHDLGFGAAYDGSRSFEIVGANAARELFERHGNARADDLWYAIAAHTVPHMAREGPAEALLTQVGSGADIFGVRRDAFDPGFLTSLEAAYPRGAVAAEMEAITTAHSVHQPIGMLAAYRALGMRFTP